MGVDVFDTLDESSMKCIRFDVCKHDAVTPIVAGVASSMKCIRFDVCKHAGLRRARDALLSSMKCIRFDVCKRRIRVQGGGRNRILNEVHTF